MRRTAAVLLAIASACAPAPAGRTTAAPGPDLPLSRLRLPEGFSIEVYARVPGARSLALGPRGIVFVGAREGGTVHALLDLDGDGRDVQVRAVATGLRWPNGVAWRGGALYVAERSRIVRVDGLEASLTRSADPRPPAVVYDRLPNQHGHGWRYARFGPDGKLYVAIGAPCNVCERPDPFATIARMAADGTGFEVIARGVRNSVGFDWRPGTGDLWFTDNGRDMLGDDVPADELNRAPRPGLHFGFPYCHQGNVPDPELGEGRPCSGFVAPAHRFGAHVAALGMRFYTGTQFPAAYRGQLFVAQHGSWNRSTPSGYQVVLVRVDASGRVTGEEPFVTGWLDGEHAWGRPVDVEILPDGTLLVSDDHAGVVYRIRHARPSTRSSPPGPRG